MTNNSEVLFPSPVEHSLEEGEGDGWEGLRENTTHMEPVVCTGEGVDDGTRSRLETLWEGRGRGGQMIHAVDTT